MRSSIFVRSGLVVVTCVVAIAAAASARQSAEWPAYGGDPGGTRYSPLQLIRPDNVASLGVAWTYRTGEIGADARDGDDLTFEVTPVLLDGTLYLNTAFGRIVALDPATGRERWTHDGAVPRDRSYSEVTSRGVTVWRDSSGMTGAPCVTRVFLGTIDARLLAVDARTGTACADFGVRGVVDLAGPVGMAGRGDYQVTSPPVVVGEVLVVGSSIGDNWARDTGPGVVRGFDARTGEERWRWDPIPRDSVGFVAGAANAWSVMSADPARDLVFVPTSSPSPDFFGGDRRGANQWANSIVALRASTGNVVWAFQTIHHDLWDYDVAAQPVLLEVMHDNRRVPALAQATKMGWIYLLHRETGEPIWRVEETPVPGSRVRGEYASPTQPVPVEGPGPLVPHTRFTPDDAWGLTEEDRRVCGDLFARHASGIFTPPSLEGTIMFPGNGSGVNWGSMAFDPERELLITNPTRLATLVQLFPRIDAPKARAPGYELARMERSPYVMRRRTVLSPGGLPCHAPPWGTLVAVDVTTGRVRWDVPFGATPEHLDLPADAAERLVGWPSGGGPIVTGSGLIFIAAAFDGRLRAVETETGRERWSHRLPRAGIATPMTYAVAGRQYVVIAAGGHGKAGLELGDYVVAFALPER